MYAGNNPLRFIDPTGLLTQDQDTWEQVFDNKDDTLGYAASEAGYDNWRDALPNMMDSSGNLVDISDRYDKNGNWVSGSDSLDGLQLKHNSEDLVTWEADETLAMAGFDIRLPFGGMTMKYGEADVKFSNGKNGFRKNFNVKSNDSYGLFFNVGESVTKTKYSRVFPSNKDQAFIQDSFLGYFMTAGAGVTAFKGFLGIEGGKTYGLDNDFKLHSNAWSGLTGGANISKGKGIGNNLGINLGLSYTWYSDPLNPDTRMDIWGFPGSNLDE